MRIGLITTWNARCGIAEYSRSLAEALRARGHTVVVLANYPVNPVPDAVDEGGVYRFFYTGWHAERGVDADLASRVVTAHALDVVHLQYQNFIYPPDFLPVLHRLAAYAPLVVTFHDAGVPVDFPRVVVARAIVHTPVTARMLAWQGAVVIPIGIHDMPAPPVWEARRALGLSSRHVLCSVGLGRTDYRAVLGVVRDLVPRYHDILYAVLGPEAYADAVRGEASRLGIDRHVVALGGYFPLRTLFAWMHASDMTLFYFAESGVEGVSSSSARLGIAARRPVVVSDVGWTRDLPGELKVPYGDLGALCERVVHLFEDAAFREAILARQEAVIRETNWARSADRHEQVYASVVRR